MIIRYLDPWGIAIVYTLALGYLDAQGISPVFGKCDSDGSFGVMLLFTYLWLVGNGRMGYNFNYYQYHSSIPY